MCIRDSAKGEGALDDGLLDAGQFGEVDLHAQITTGHHHGVGSSQDVYKRQAQTRANYYTPGSPVQFVCVELLKGDVSGEHAVCLTFKNISDVYKR